MVNVVMAMKPIFKPVDTVTPGMLYDKTRIFTPIDASLAALLQISWKCCACPLPGHSSVLTKNIHIIYFISHLHYPKKS